MRKISDFSRNVLIVLSGTTVAQLIPIATLPILTRLFTPDDFGLFYLFSSISAILLIAATGKYELAILVPKEKEEALEVGYLASLLSLFWSALIFLIIILFKNNIGALFNEPDLGLLLLFIPLQIFIKSGNDIFRYWFNRNKAFKLLTGNQILLSISNVIFRIGAGWWSWGSFGLVLATIAAQFTGLLWYIFALFNQGFSSFKKIEMNRLKALAIKYKKFPRDMVVGGLFHSGSLQLPPILLNSLFVSSIAGYFGIMNRVALIPVNTISKAYEEVFKQRISEAIHQNTPCGPIFYRTFKQLLFISIGPAILFAFIAPYLFEWALGTAWKEAGIYARIFAVPILLQFILTPLLSTFYLLEKTHLYTLSYLLQIILVLASIFLGYYLGNKEPIIVIYALAGAYVISYMISFVLLLKIIRTTA